MGEGHVMMEAEIGVASQQVREAGDPAGHGRVSPESLYRTNPAST